MCSEDVCVCVSVVAALCFVCAVQMWQMMSAAAQRVLRWKESRTELPLPGTHGLHHPEGQRWLHHGDRHISKTNGTYEGKWKILSTTTTTITVPSLLPAPAIS